LSCSYSSAAHEGVVAAGAIWIRFLGGFRFAGAYADQGNVQQLREALGYKDQYEFLIHDRDSIFVSHLDESIRRLGVRVLKSPQPTRRLHMTGFLRTAGDYLNVWI